MAPCLIGGETGRNVHLRGGVPCPGMTLNSTLGQFTCYFFIGRMLILGLIFFFLPQPAEYGA